MKNYQLTVTFRFNAIDDVEARQLAMHCLTSYHISRDFSKLQEVFENKRPRPVKL